MATTREQATNAVLQKLVATGAFNMIGRRNRDPESIPTNETPALFVLNHSETNLRPRPNTPPIRTLHIRVVVYTDAGGSESAVPSSTIAALLEIVDAAFAPDDVSSNRCTLGGLVYSAIVQGETIEAPGDVTGKGLAIVPIEVIIP
jgi:hypothetical protein